MQINNSTLRPLHAPLRNSNITLIGTDSHACYAFILLGGWYEFLQTGFGVVEDGVRARGVDYGGFVEVGDVGCYVGFEAEDVAVGGLVGG